MQGPYPERKNYERSLQKKRKILQDHFSEKKMSSVAHYPKLSLELLAKRNHLDIMGDVKNVRVTKGYLVHLFMHVAVCSVHAITLQPKIWAIRQTE